MPFTFTAAALNNLSQTISNERLTSYVAMAKGDLITALFYYERNRVLSEGMYGMLQGLEVALRNSIHRVLLADTGQAAWYDRPGTLFQPEKDAVLEAKSNIPNGVPQTPGRVVAQLTFGFWVKLLSRNYEKDFWVRHLYKSFPNLRRPDRKTVYERLDEIRILRNKIAHHERILQRDLKKDSREIIETVTWICPVTASWLNIHNSLQSLIF